MSSATDEFRLIPGAKLWAVLGISRVTGWRWQHNPNLGFPRPIVIAGRPYWRASDIREWCARMASAQARVDATENTSALPAVEQPQQR